MKRIIILMVLMTSLWTSAMAEDEIVANDSFTKLSHGTKRLLATEMRFIEQSMKDILFHMVAGEYSNVEKISRDIQDSFIFKKQITKAQIKEIGSILPKEFMMLDLEFHETAGQMAQSAEMEDSFLIAEQFSNMVQLCVKCHSTYAIHRFPNLEE